jgi:23S rRNA (adenine2503-C2)-methyltransferase
MKLIFDLTLPELVSYFKTLNEPAFRANQVWEGLYKNFWETPDEFTQLPTLLRNRLKEDFTFDALQPTRAKESFDKKTIKTLFKLNDGNNIESVLMKYERRRTLCISTQVGCAMGCVFCATGQMGFRRHLSSGEIVAQVIYYARLLHETGETVTNIVFMGMGEPFHNYNHTMAAIDLLNHSGGYNFGSRRFTISTVGIVPAIRRFTDEKRQVNLAISLHAADDTLRSSMLPIAKKYPLNELFGACRDYCENTGRRITFEWALVAGINDTAEQAHLLVKNIKGMLCHVNVIPLNPTIGYHGEATSRERAKFFLDILAQNGIPSTLRMRRGIDIQAGCGQLAILE